MAREDLHFRLRIPEDLKKRIEAHADYNNRSMTAEIISRLTESVNGDARLRLANDELKELRSKLAYQEGVTAAYRDSLLVFAQRMKGSKEDGETLLKEIAKEIAARGKGESSDT